MTVRALPRGAAVRRARDVLREVLEKAAAPRETVVDAGLIVAELAGNCERHARPPYELRIATLYGRPVWCEVVDGDPDLGDIPSIFERLRVSREYGFPAADEVPPEYELLAEGGRGLLIAYELSRGRCRAYVTNFLGTRTPAKAVGFALPARPA